MTRAHDVAATDLLEQALRHIPGVGVEHGVEAADLAIRSGDRTHSIQVKTWGNRAPAEAEGLVIWVLRNGTSEIHEKLRRDDQSFVDLAGVVRLHLPDLLIDRNDLEPVPARSDDSRNPFSDRASGVPRALFESFSGDERPSLREVASLADLPLSTTSYSVRALEDLGVVEAERLGRTKRVRLRDPLALIHEWTSAYTWKSNVMVAFDAPIGDLERFLRRLPEALDGHEWALTLQAGASRVAPHAVWNSVHLYLSADDAHDLMRIGKSIGWQPSKEGRAVLLAPYYRESLWKGVRRVGKLPVVSDLQLILDLWHYPVRGREQAELLLEKAGLHERA